MFGYAEPNHATAGAQINDFAGNIGRDVRQRKVYQQFGFGAGNEYLGCHEKRQAIKFSPPREIGNRFSVNSP